jgi:hypothetical protein
VSTIPHHRLSATVSDPLGDVSFTPSPGSPLYYEARAYAEGTTTPVLATKYLGLSAPYADGKIRVNLRTMLNALPPGNYDLIIATVGAGGTDESVHASAVVVPLLP